MDLKFETRLQHLAIQGQAREMRGIEELNPRWVTAFYVQYSKVRDIPI